ncbi:hypothetical protein GALL_135550 [mine drainage metagenome]|uniref:ABC-type transport auxiliary lipoprotein component domain-containing protein n=1 Tax=mine drainage metagenome TaxID=410659 RepID=A0A1J5S8T8_9ZZZZ
MKPLSCAATFLGLALALVTNSGCQVIPAPQPDPTHYYTLSLPDSVETTVPSSSTGLRVGLNRVDLAPYLRKGVLVVRKGGNEVVFNDFARWAEPLDAGISRSLQMCLSADPRISHVSVAPMSIDERRDYDVTIHVRRADGVLGASGATVRFVAVIDIARPGEPPHLEVQKAFNAPATAWDGHDYAALASDLSKDVVALAREIADSLPLAPTRR